MLTLLSERGAYTTTPVHINPPVPPAKGIARQHCPVVCKGWLPSLSVEQC